MTLAKVAREFMRLSSITNTVYQLLRRPLRIRALSPPLFALRLCVTAVTALVTCSLMAFLGLALNYGFHPDFFARWLKAFLVGYVCLVPVLLVLVPPVQRGVTALFRRRAA